MQMWKHVLQDGNFNGFGTNAQTVFDKGRNLERIFMVVDLTNKFTSTCCVGTDSVELKPFTRVSNFCPVKSKRLCLILFPIETREGVPLISCKTASPLRSMTQFAVYSRLAGRYWLSLNGLCYCQCQPPCLQALRWKSSQHHATRHYECFYN